MRRRPCCAGQEGVGISRTRHGSHANDAGKAIARVVRVQEPLCRGWRRFHAVVLVPPAANVVGPQAAEPPDGAASPVSAAAT